MNNKLTPEDIEKHIIFCKLRSEHISKKYEKNYDKETIKKIFKSEFTNKLERYYTLCLKNVTEYNHYTNYEDRQSINICETIIDRYLENK